MYVPTSPETKTKLSKKEVITVSEQMDEAMEDLPLERRSVNMERAEIRERDRMNKIDNDKIDELEDEFKPTMPQKRQMRLPTRATKLAGKSKDSNEKSGE